VTPPIPTPVPLTERITEELREFADADDRAALHASARALSRLLAEARDTITTLTEQLADARRELDEHLYGVDPDSPLLLAGEAQLAVWCPGGGPSAVSWHRRRYGVVHPGQTVTDGWVQIEWRGPLPADGRRTELVDLGDLVGLGPASITAPGGQVTAYGVCVHCEHVVSLYPDGGAGFEVGAVDKWCSAAPVAGAQHETDERSLPADMLEA